MAKQTQLFPVEQMQEDITNLGSSFNELACLSRTEKIGEYGSYYWIGVARYYLNYVTNKYSKYEEAINKLNALNRNKLSCSR